MGIRRLTLLAFALTLAAPAAAYADELPASVRVLSCSPWQEGTGGTVSFEARMRSLPGTERMAIRLRLLEKSGEGRFEPVAAEGLGAWRKSRPDALAFRYDHQVKGLRKGAVYRAEVDYRWVNRDGEKIRSTERISQPCKQPGGQPNLRIADISISPGTVPGTATYKVTVVNRGSADARGVVVVLRADGDVVDESEPIETLERDESRTVTFSGPVCRKTLRAVVDPKRSIAESNEDDNVRAADCV